MYGIEWSHGGLVPFGGGLPLLLGERVVGAVGVSGGTADQDVRAAEACVRAFAAA